MCNLRWKGCASRVRGTMKAVPARLRGVFVAFARDKRKTDISSFIHDRY